MTTKIEIKKPISKDIEQIKEITKLSYKIPYRENGLITGFKEADDLQEKFNQGEIGIIAAYFENKIIGALRYKIIENNEFYLFKIAVLKEFRNIGVATKLLAAAEEEAKKFNCKKIKLDCAQEKFLPRFYEKNGYKVDEIREHGNHHDVCMSKET